jgi:hypothetical protein
MASTDAGVSVRINDAQRLNPSIALRPSLASNIISFTLEHPKKAKDQIDSTDAGMSIRISDAHPGIQRFLSVDREPQRSLLSALSIQRRPPTRWT